MSLSGHGGGMYAGHGSNVKQNNSILATNINGNYADSNNKCWNNKVCNKIESNKVNREGGAFYLNNGNINVSYGYINNHRAGIGTVIYSDNNSNIRHT